MEKRVCKWCNKTFEFKKGKGTSKVKYCSDICRYEAKKYSMRERNKRVDQKLKLEIQINKKLQKELFKNLGILYRYFLNNCVTAAPYEGIQCISKYVGDTEKGKKLYWEFREKYRREHI